ncbi:hypothetical protein D6T64_04320 [Cryobacterium melibiosiphilum]|uniref:Uncharacterized protein n=1 Tax=Cryobacterium melibiosiphilum TaxID=995039 RepID=A0A3A5MYP4_9MICO|nr:hypothetical protein [Cryobacterium melibiosiphilum]RJT90254.1 hypothetical protein D6T64_04320 [Cryobacterium melibiosiphilum]
MTHHHAGHPERDPDGRANRLTHLSSQDPDMNDPTRPQRPHAPTDPETGWWDDHGRPAPWPDDFADPAAGWTTGNSHGPDAGGYGNDPENQPF